MTLDNWIQKPSPSLTYSQQDSHVKLLAMLERGWDSMTQEEHYFLKSLGLYKRSDLKLYSLKMLEDSLVNQKSSPKFSPRYMSYGTMLNGKLLTANISFRKAEREYSLSDIIETIPTPKYFLSEKATEKAFECANKRKFR